MAWTYFSLTCNFTGELSKSCVDISAGTDWYSATEITGSSSVNPDSHTQIVTASQIGILLGQIDNFEKIYEDITRYV